MNKGLYGAIINSSKVPFDRDVIISFLMPDDIDKQKSAIAIPISAYKKYVSWFIKSLKLTNLEKK